LGERIPYREIWLKAASDSSPPRKLSRTLNRFAYAAGVRVRARARARESGREEGRKRMRERERERERKREGERAVAVAGDRA